VQVQPGATTAAIVTWASGRAPAGFAIDVQVKVPGSASFVTWLTWTTATNLTFSPSTGPYTGPGTYQFRVGREPTERQSSHHQFISSSTSIR
jgi:hypothetical protein